MNILQQIKVLYIEDDKEHQKELQIFLKRRLGKLILANNGEEGFELYKKEKPDLIITDLRMPKLDGREFTKKIREIDNKTPIIITTAFFESETILDMITNGITSYIVKPIDTDILLEEINKQSKVIFENSEKEGLFLGDFLISSRKEQLELEKKIQTKIAAFIKEKTGKGPKIVKSFITSRFIEISILGASTKYEEALLHNSENKKMIVFLREAFYSDFEKEIIELIRSVIPAKFSLIDMEIESKENKLIFKIL